MQQLGHQGGGFTQYTGLTFNANTNSMLPCTMFWPITK